MLNTSAFFLPNVSLFGAGCLNEIGVQAARLERKKLLLVTDSFLAKTETVARIRQRLQEQGIALSVYADVTPNPTLQGVHAAFAQYQAEGCDGVISLGGGSAHDCGKAVCILAANPAPLAQYVGVDRFPHRSAPMLAVNTTAGTGSEITNCFLITDTESGTKLIFEGANALADVAINDPELMRTLPKSLTAATGMDALTHAIECYVSNLSFCLTNELALLAIRHIYKNLPRAVEQPDDLAAREGMIYGEYLAGMAFGSGGVGLVHAIAHAVGGVYNLPHGLCNAILLPYVIRFNGRACGARYRDILCVLAPDAQETGETAAEALSKRVHALSMRIGTAKTLRELGVRREDFPLLAEKALQDSCSETNPVAASAQDICTILEAAFTGADFAAPIS